MKAISNVDAILPNQLGNPHYAPLIEGHLQLDTEGNAVTSM